MDDYGGGDMKTKLIYILMLFLLFVPVTVMAAEEQVVINIQGMTCDL